MESIKMPWYKTLGVSPSSTASEIQSAYWGLAKKYHPDKNLGLSEAARKAREEKLKEINVAYKMSKEKSNVGKTITQGYEQKSKHKVNYDLGFNLNQVAYKIKKYNENISDEKIYFIITALITLRLISYEKTEIFSFWRHFEVTKKSNIIDEIYLDLIISSQIIEEYIPDQLKNEGLLQYVRDILLIVFMSQEENLISFPKVL